MAEKEFICLICNETYIDGDTYSCCCRKCGAEILICKKCGGDIDTIENYDKNMAWEKHDEKE